MALGPQHRRASTATAVLGSVGSALLFPPPFSIYLILGFVIGRYATPDTRDLHEKRDVGELIVYEELGWLPGLLWQAYWYPLACRIPHRKWLSHFAGPATVIAWMYLWIPIITVSFAFYGPEIGLWVWMVGSCTLPGWFVQDLVHLAQDDWEFNW